MAKIFIVEDNQQIIRNVTDELSKWQHSVATVDDWQDVTDEIMATQPDLVIFDITLPSFDGFYWIQDLRKHSQVPIIVISAADIDSNVMHAVAAGADDYLMKPFSMTVLEGKEVTTLRAEAGQEGNATQVDWDNNHFNTLTNEVQNERGQVQLTPTEGALLQVLLSHRNQTVSKATLLE